jgi:hypothetical protein
MSWSDPINLYCERGNISFWAEPLNALSNAAFLIAAAAAFAHWKRHRVNDVATLVLILVTCLVGLGSFAFHTFATRGALLADVIPIALFITFYLFFALRRFLNLALVPALAILVFFIAISPGISVVLPRHFLNGSGQYLPALAALIAVGTFTPAEATRHAIRLASFIFAVSLVFRTIDDAICAAWPLGTHFIWHVLNAAVLYILLRTAASAEAAIKKARV